ncbi:MAG TPA: fumarylacetoacetate hydrolase family protein [Candidatus Acidoferrales bacterium]|nr:fumarylacetoacetate hydrolase family protein [Candidatus Acidoferrales bacterium]
MKIARFNDDRIGVVRNDTHIVDVSDAISHRVEKGPQTVIEEVIDQFDSYRRVFERRLDQESGVPLASVKLLAPVPRPSKCLAAFSNYLDSPTRKIENMPNEYFYKAPELLGPEGTIELLDLPQVVVYQPEAELAFVMKRTPRNVKQADAMNYVFGYVPFFDISARGLVRRTQFVPKGQDTHGPCGPWITTSDEVVEPHKLVVKSWVNGQPRQNYGTQFMAHKIDDQIAWLTRFVRFQPGDVVATGTYHVGLGPLNDGDILEIEIVGLGKARFFVKGYGPRKEADWLPGVSQPTPPPGGGITKI